MSIHTPTYTQGPTETSTKQHPLHCDYSYYSSSSCCRFRDTDFFLSAISVINYNICKYHSRYFIMLFFLFVCFFLNLAAKFKFNCELRGKKKFPTSADFCLSTSAYLEHLCVNTLGNFYFIKRVSRFHRKEV